MARGSSSALGREDTIGRPDAPGSAGAPRRAESANRPEDALKGSAEAPPFRADQAGGNSEGPPGEQPTSLRAQRQERQSRPPQGNQGRDLPMEPEPYYEDEASPDDPEFEDSTLHGVEAALAILEGTIIEEIEEL